MHAVREQSARTESFVCIVLYMVFFKNVRDATRVHCLARQMFPKNSEAMMQGYKDATGKPYGYLLIDMTQSMDDRYRLRTKIFPGDTGEVFVPI